MTMALLVAAVFQPSFVMAKEKVCNCDPCRCEKTLEQVVDEWENRCRCVEPDTSSYEYKEVSNSNSDGTASNSDGTAGDGSEEELPRFIEIHRDESFVYYMDRKTARYLPIPHMAKEKMIDVWIKLEPLEFLEGDYTYPSKYYLEHYLIRPKTQQIQFVCELEVTGRPQNAIMERDYSPANWEGLVPGSVEDDIYHGAIKALKKRKGFAMTRHGKNLTMRDALEEYLRISL